MSYTRGDSDAIFGFELVSDIDALARPVSGYDYLHYQSSVHTSEIHCDKQLDGSNANAVDISSQTSKFRRDSMTKNKYKDAPNSFPANVRSLLATGILDGVPEEYILFWQVLNAYEFEHHAGCKTKHPNNHIYFEIGKTVYQITQELRSTPQSLLFEAIQTVTGSPINQKAFHIWKESFQAATRELQRINGKEELNLMAMKRSREEEITVEALAMANCVNILQNNSTSQLRRFFECKTCNKRFESFQALGGHRASHKKLKALGGYMRKHRDKLEEKKEKASFGKKFFLDLNLTPYENDQLTFGIIPFRVIHSLL